MSDPAEKTDETVSGALPEVASGQVKSIIGVDESDEVVRVPVEECAGGESELAGTAEVEPELFATQLMIQALADVDDDSFASLVRRPRLQFKGPVNIRRRLLRRVLRQKMNDAKLNGQTNNYNLLKTAHNDPVVFEALREEAEARTIASIMEEDDVPDDARLIRFFDWLIKNGPALISLIELIISLFGSMSASTTDQSSFSSVMASVTSSDQSKGSTKGDLDDSAWLTASFGSVA